jgi:GcrA cell cycle regulator
LHNQLSAGGSKLPAAVALLRESVGIASRQTSCNLRLYASTADQPGTACVGALPPLLHDPSQHALADLPSILEFTDEFVLRPQPNEDAMHAYTDEQIEFLRECREVHGMSWGVTVQAFAGKYGVRLSRSAVTGKGKRSGIDGPSTNFLPPADLIEPVIFEGVAQVALIDLEPHHCRWPIGENLGAIVPHFCGCDAVPAQSYCADHLADATGARMPNSKLAKNFRSVPFHKIDVRTLEEA